MNCGENVIVIVFQANSSVNSSCLGAESAFVSAVELLLHVSVEVGVAESSLNPDGASERIRIL